MIDISQNNEGFKASPNERASLRGKTTLSEQHGLSPASNKLVGRADLLKKVYFPRLAIPTAAVLSEIVAFALALLVLLGMMLYYRVIPHFNALWLPLLLLLVLVTSLFPHV
jgi:ABC-type polysaccharide/polyol phosphate export permease